MKNNIIFILTVIFLLPLFNSCKKDDNIVTPVIEPEVIDGPYDKKITVLKQQDNVMWVGTFESGLYKYENELWSVFTDTISDILSNKINCLTTSSDGSIWIGTNKGISKLNNGNWTNFTEAEELYSNDIRSLACDYDENIWIGTRKNRVLKYDGESFTEFYVNSEASNGSGHIHTISPDLNGNIWVGSCFSGLSRFDGTDWYNDISFELGSFVENSFYDTNGNLWVGQISYGIFKFSDNTWTNYSETDGLINNKIKCITEDQEKNIWIGTSSGISKFDGSTFTNFTTDDGLLSNKITALASDQNGNMWVGSYVGGLTIINKD